MQQDDLKSLKSTKKYEFKTLHCWEKLREACSLKLQGEKCQGDQGFLSPNNNEKGARALSRDKAKAGSKIDAKLDMILNQNKRIVEAFEDIRNQSNLQLLVGEEEEEYHQFLADGIVDRMRAAKRQKLPRAADVDAVQSIQESAPGAVGE